MKHFETEEAVNQFKKLPFSKSWQNVFVSKVKRILNTTTKQLEDRELENFIYIPAPSLVRHLGSDKEFLMFRSENKNSKDWNYNLVSDAMENNNRRLAITYVEGILSALEVNFVIDDGYTLYILDEELNKLTKSGLPGLKEFMHSLYNAKILAQKKGASDSWN